MTTKAELTAQLRKARAAVREAFVDGAKWKLYEADGATMFGSECEEAEAAAERRYPHAPWPHLARIRELEHALATYADRYDDWRNARASGCDALIAVAGDLADTIQALGIRQPRNVASEDRA